MKINFLSWYYRIGFSELFRIWGNVLFFIEWKFNIFGLAATLFSPWKRDVTFRDWIGFHPLRAIDRFISNFFSRIIGAVVRFAVMTVGTVAFFLVFFFGLINLLGWFFLPVLFGVALSLFLEGFFLFSILLALFCSKVLFFAALAYGKFRYRVVETSIEHRKKQKWFPRALARIGFKQKNIPKKAFVDNASFESWLLSSGIKKELFEEACALESRRFHFLLERGKFWTKENLAKSMPIGIGWTYAYTPKIDRYALDLTEGDPTEYQNIHFFGREEEQEMLELVLERPTQANALLVSDPGIGKRTLIHSLARRIRENRTKRSLFGTRVLVFELGRLLSDVAARNENPDAVVRELLYEATLAGNIILVIENLDTFLLPENGHSSFGAVLSEALSFPALRIIGTMNTSAYRRFAKDGGEILKHFETITIREPDEETTYEALVAKFESVERRRVLFTFAAFRSIVDLSKRYEWDKAFPERAIDLAEEVILFWKERSSNDFIFPEDVERFVSMKTGMPVGKIEEGERETLLNLEDTLRKRVLGQEEAIRQVAEAIRRGRTGLANEKKPRGSFLFLGPTGVGKTETAKALAAAVFGDEERMIRLDMSEFQSPDSVARLIGSPETGETGRLADLAREHPYSILLLDEIEKAYPRALDIFLQGLDEGFFTDGAGKKVNLRNMIVIATSNAGASSIRNAIVDGVLYDDMRKTITDEVIEKGVFRPEFLNRFDAIVFFRPLGDAELADIIRNRLAQFADKLKREKDIEVSFEDGVMEAILAKGYEPEFGARSINRFVEDRIEDAVVKKILSESITSGGVISIRKEDI